MEQYFQLMNLDNEYFVVRFKSKVDYTKALSQGPWVVFGHYLTMQPWSPLFSTTQDFSLNMVVWIHFLGFPSVFHKSSVQAAVGEVIGQVFKVDYSTESMVTSENYGSRMIVQRKSQQNVHQGRLNMEGIENFVDKKMAQDFI